MRSTIPTRRSNAIHLKNLRNRQKGVYKSPKTDVDNSGNFRIPVQLRLGTSLTSPLKVKDRVDLKIRLRRQLSSKKPEIKSNTGPIPRFSKNKPQLISKKSSSSEEAKVIVGNLNQNVTIDDIKELCASIGSQVDVMKLHSGTILVTFKTLAEANDAISNFNGRKLDGRPMAMTLIH